MSNDSFTSISVAMRVTLNTTYLTDFKYFSLGLLSTVMLAIPSPTASKLPFSSTTTTLVLLLEYFNLPASSGVKLA